MCPTWNSYKLEDEAAQLAVDQIKSIGSSNSESGAVMYFVYFV